MREIIIGLKVNKEEHELIKKAAKKSHVLSAAGFVRVCVFERLRKEGFKETKIA